MSPGGATSSGSPGTPKGGREEREPAAGRQSPNDTRRPGPSLPAPVAVSWSEAQRRPIAFVWRGRRHRIERLLETWVVETGWWRDGGRVSRSYWRVRAGGRVFDLRYDRIGKAWTLEQALN